MYFKGTKAICEKYDLLVEIDKVANRIEVVEVNHPALKGEACKSLVDQPQSS